MGRMRADQRANTITFISNPKGWPIPPAAPNITTLRSGTLAWAKPLLLTALMALDPALRSEFILSKSEGTVKMSSRRCKSLW
jgi:hypothetical protein